MKRSSGWTGWAGFISEMKDKVQVYVPQGQWWIVEAIEKLIQADRAAGIRDSFSSKALAVWRTGLEELKRRSRSSAAR